MVKRIGSGVILWESPYMTVAVGYVLDHRA